MGSGISRVGGGGGQEIKGAGSLMEGGELKRVGSGIPKVEEPRGKGGRKPTGGRRTEEGGKWDSQRGGEPRIKGEGNCIGGQQEDRWWQEHMIKGGW